MKMFNAGNTNSELMPPTGQNGAQLRNKILTVLFSVY